MHWLHSFGPILVFLLSFIIFDVTAIVLRDLPHAQERSWLSERIPLLKRGSSLASMNLRNTETFLWGGSQGNNGALGDFTVRMPDDHENILSMQRFIGMTSSVNCNRDTNTIDIAFKDDQAFDYAKNEWNWVNQADDHTFVLVAGTGDCGWNDYRVPFIVSTIEYNKDHKTAHLAAKASEWKTVAHSYDLRVGALSKLSSRLRKRIGATDYDKDLSISFQNKLPFKTWDFPDKEATVTLGCDECETKGSLQFGFHLETSYMVPKKVLVMLNPRGVSATIDPRLTLSANYTGPKKALRHEFLPTPNTGLYIPGNILDVGPETIFTAFVELSSLKGSANMTSGVTISLQDSAQLTLDLLNVNLTSSGFTPVVSKKPLNLDANISGDVKAIIKGRVALAIKALGYGYSAGVSLSPYLSGKFESITSTKGACKGDKNKRLFGVNIESNYGAQFKAEAENVWQKENPLLDRVLLGIEEPLPKSCIPVGPMLAVPPKVVAPANTTKTNTTSSWWSWW